MSCRKDYRDLTDDERDLFVAALYHLKSTGVIDAFAAEHADNFDGAHGGSTFLPWHREFLRRFEEELRAYDSSILIPYWNEMEDDAVDSLLWSDDFLGQFDSSWGLNRSVGLDSSLANSVMVNNALNDSSFVSFRSTLEIDIHDRGHLWVCSFGVMRFASSPGDPVFYLHHCYDDMLWAQWQVRHSDPNDLGATFVPSGGAGGEDLTEAMAPWLTTPGDVLDHRQINSYDYPSGFERDLPIVTLETPTVNFNSVPEGETTMRAIVFDLDSCDEVHFSVTSGPTVTSEPAGTVFGVLNTAVTGNPEVDPKARIWLTFAGTSDGDIASGTVTVECDRRYISDVEDSIDDRVYAIGLGTAENIQPSALSQLCDGNDGYLLLTGALNDDAYFRLAKYYQQILAGVTNSEVVLDPDGWIQPGQKHRIPFWLNEGDITANVVLLSTAPNAILYALETPDGDVITPATAAVTPALAFGGGRAVTYYRTTLPVPTGANIAHAGKWHAVLQVDPKLFKRYLAALDNYPERFTQATAHGVRYSLSAHAYSTLRMHARVHQSSFEPGAVLRLQAQLTEYGLPVNHRATVRAELVRPNESSSILSLSESDPGVFEAAIEAPAAGVYRFRVMAYWRDAS